MLKPKIYILNAMASGLDTLNFLIDNIPIHGVVGLDIENKAVVANYGQTKIWAEQFQIPYTSVSNYSLKDEKEKEKIQLLDIDILIVAGWQRLIPKWLIDQCQIGVIGLHGSPWGITKGRGRSPQNWAIIMGERTFEISAFLIQPGADDGPILATKTYQLKDSDDIVSSYVKASWLYAEMIMESIPKIVTGWRGTPQSGSAEYLPQRCFEDGRIDWQWSTVDIDRQVRALTKPYPGAWTKLNGSIVYIWKAQPVENLTTDKKIGGEIIAVYPQIPAFLVSTGDGALLVRAWEFTDELTNETMQNIVGIFKNHKAFDTNFKGYEQIQCIFNKHKNKFPDKKISTPLANWADKYKY